MLFGGEFHGTQNTEELDAHGIAGLLAISVTGNVDKGTDSFDRYMIFAIRLGTCGATAVNEEGAARREYTAC